MTKVIVMAMVLVGCGGVQVSETPVQDTDAQVAPVTTATDGSAPQVSDPATQESTTVTTDVSVSPTVGVSDPTVAPAAVVTPTTPTDTVVTPSTSTAPH